MGRGCKDIFFLLFLRPDYTFCPAEWLSEDSPTVSVSGQVQVFNVGEICQDVVLTDEQIYCYYESNHGAQLKFVEVSTGNMVILDGHVRWSLKGIKLFPSDQRLLVTDRRGDIYDERERISGFKAENLWFSSDRKQIVTNNAQVFNVGEGEHTTKYVGDIQGVGSIVSASHSQSTGNYLVITETDPGVVFIDDETLERKEMIPYPEVQVDKWTEGNLPRLESLFYTPVGQFIFANNKIPEYYVIGYVRYSKSIVMINDF